jgi:hypothetical protein
MDFQAIKASEVGLPLIRPLPTIFAYARGARSLQIVPAVLEEEFFAHVDCLIDVLDTACLRAQVPTSACEEVTQKARDLSRREKGELVDGVNELLTNLDNLSRIHKSTLKRELSSKPAIYRDIYWGRVYTKKITFVHQEEDASSLDRIVKRLEESCSYEVSVEAEKDLALKPMSSDLVIFHPTRGPVRPATLATAATFGLPTLILVDLGKSVEDADPVAVRLAHQYAKSGLNVLHRPFTPLRLFSAIDTCYVDHLFKKPTFAGARARGEVA